MKAASKLHLNGKQITLFKSTQFKSTILQDNNNNDPDQDGTRPIDVINPPSHPQNNTTSENVQDETNEDGIQDVQMLIRTNKNGTLKNKN